MGIAAVKIKIMPKSPETDLEQLKQEIQEIIESNKAIQLRLETEPIGFGLNSIIATFGWDEDTEIDSLTNQLKKIPEVNSAEVIDIRRSFG